MAARIYRPSRNAMQSGKARSRNWLLEYEPEEPRRRDPLMGWTSSGDMKQQIRLRFETKEQAIDYAERNGIAYRVFEPEAKSTRIEKAYSDNFAYSRKDNWTH